MLLFLSDFFLFSQLFDSILHFTDLPKESRLSYCQVRNKKTSDFNAMSFYLPSSKLTLNLMILFLVDKTKYAMFSLPACLVFLCFGFLSIEHKFPISFLILLFWVSNPPASVANLVPDDKTFCTSGRIPDREVEPSHNTLTLPPHHCRTKTAKIS